MGICIAPSILSADFSRLGEEVRAVQAAGCDYIHVDVMDGAFVPNITIGQPVVAALRRVATVPLDVHLMIEDPDRYITAFAEAGADVITVHAEACRHLHRTLQSIRRTKKLAGVSINPATPLSQIEWILSEVDWVLVMSVNPGFSGQQFIASSVEKVRQLKRLAPPTVKIEVDGGINAQNAKLLVDAGADILVAGAAIFGHADYVSAIAALRAAPSTFTC